MSLYFYFGDTPIFLKTPYVTQTSVLCEVRFSRLIREESEIAQARPSRRVYIGAGRTVACESNNEFTSVVF